MDLEFWNSALKVGLFLGGICAVLALITETILSGRKDAAVNGLAKESSDQKERIENLAIQAETQRERAANAERDAAEAKVVAGQAGEGTLKALRELAEARTRQANAERAMEVERQARLKIEERLAPRTLSETDAKKLLAVAAQFAGQRFDVLRYSGAGEANALSFQIADVLDAAGWKRRDIGVWYAQLPQPGIRLYTDVKAPPIDAASKLAEAFNNLGFFSEYVRTPPSFKTPEDAILLVVGPKP
jgi:hypothetical protein